MNKKELKIIVVGSVGSGKSTSIRTISEIPVAGTEASASERQALHRKETTTVAMEYGIVHIEGAKLHLYGTPGQRRFDFMGSLLCKGASGMMVMIDNGGDNPMEELDYYLKFHGHFLKDKPAVIGVTHYDDTRTDTGLIDYHNYCISKNFNIPVMRLDAREKDHVERTMRRLLTEIERTENYNFKLTG
ncbi:ATP/GTP-binding protein [Methylomicrobium sp. Wu6]|uniref:GTP-binding protein n=1 Tax=Methylomicrobium sp. Wu6 TaxID=3107928 RepID=UPI002DD68D43|nr:ATP/GTP-binding protein [Methylomicrobium sp. Wu6]MEC4748237.1 GTPase [Methylomicrobium sp. Wu6]